MGLGVYTQPIEARTAQSSKSVIRLSLLLPCMSTNKWFCGDRQSPLVGGLTQWRFSLGATLSGLLESKKANGAGNFECQVSLSGDVKRWQGCPRAPLPPPPLSPSLNPPHPSTHPPAWGRALCIVSKVRASVCLPPHYGEMCRDYSSYHYVLPRHGTQNVTLPADCRVPPFFFNLFIYFPPDVPSLCLYPRTQESWWTLHLW